VDSRRSRRVDFKKMRNWIDLSGDKRLKDDWLAMMHEDDVQEKSMTCFWSSMMGGRTKRQSSKKKIELPLRNYQTTPHNEESPIKSSPLRNFMLNLKPSKSYIVSNKTPASQSPTNRSPMFVMASLAISSSWNRNIQQSHVVRETTPQAFSGSSGAFLAPFITNDLLPSPSSVLENLVLQSANTPSDLDLDECVIIVDTGLSSHCSSSSSSSSNFSEKQELQQNITCPICLESFENGDMVVKLPCPCKHSAYHKECVGQWLKNNNTCPMCRTLLEKKKNNNNNNV